MGLIKNSDTAAPYLLGKNPLAIDAHSNVLLNPYLGFASSSVEICAASAIDIALWDLRGKALNCPVYELLGGLAREKIRVYNTCAGYTYNQGGANRRLVSTSGGDEPAAGPYDEVRRLVRGEKDRRARGGLVTANAPHDCVGPVVMIASLHLALNAPNAIFQEVVRAYYTG